MGAASEERHAYAWAGGHVPAQSSGTQPNSCQGSVINNCLNGSFQADWAAKAGLTNATYVAQNNASAEHAAAATGSNAAPAQQQNGDPTLPTAVQEPISPLDKALGPTPSNMLMVVTGDLGELAELGKALTGAAEASEALSKAGTIEKLTADAKELYPRLAEKADQLHHVIPKYLGGAQDGALAKIPAAYHQVITNAFRTLAPYGQAISRTTQEVTNIVKQVYSMFPLP